MMGLMMSQGRGEPVSKEKDNPQSQSTMMRENSLGGTKEGLLPGMNSNNYEIIKNMVL